MRCRAFKHVAPFSFVLELELQRRLGMQSSRVEGFLGKGQQLAGCRVKGREGAGPPVVHDALCQLFDKFYMGKLSGCNFAS